MQSELEIVDALNNLIVQVEENNDGDNSSEYSCSISDDESITPLEDILKEYKNKTFKETKPVPIENPFKDVVVDDLPIEVLKTSDTLTNLGKIQSFNVYNDTTFAVITTESTVSKKLVVEVNTLVCTSDRILIGRVVEVFGSIDEPFYVAKILLANQNLVVGSVLFSPDKFTKRIEREAIEKERLIKGSDATDKEGQPAEGYFSDDEKEREYKRAKKGGVKTRIGPLKNNKVWNPVKQQNPKIVYVPVPVHPMNGMPLNCPPPPLQSYSPQVFIKPPQIPVKQKKKSVSDLYMHLKK